MTNLFKWFVLLTAFLFVGLAFTPSARSSKPTTRILCTWGRVVAAQDPDMLLVRVVRDSSFLLEDLRQDRFLPVPATLLCRLDQKF